MMVRGLPFFYRCGRERAAHELRHTLDGESADRALLNDGFPFEMMLIEQVGDFLNLVLVPIDEKRHMLNGFKERLVIGLLRELPAKIVSSQKAGVPLCRLTKRSPGQCYRGFLSTRGVAFAGSIRSYVSASVWIQEAPARSLNRGSRGPAHY